MDLSDLSAGGKGVALARKGKIITDKHLLGSLKLCSNIRHGDRKTRPLMKTTPYICGYSVAINRAVVRFENYLEGPFS